MRLLLVMFFVGLLNLSYANSGFVEQTNPEIKKAIASTLSWVELVDKESYDESWELTADVFRKNVTQEKWREIAAKVKGEYGNVNQRSIFYSDYGKSNTLIEVKFNSVTSISKKIIESIYLRKENAKWKVSGYWIK